MDFVKGNNTNEWVKSLSTRISWCWLQNNYTIEGMVDARNRYNMWCLNKKYDQLLYNYRHDGSPIVKSSISCEYVLLDNHTMKTLWYNL